MPDIVFISYATQDKPVADAACAHLEHVGIRCWIAPRDIEPGSEWGASLIAAIERSRIMVVIFSRYSNQSPQVVREITVAVRHAVIIIPFKIDDATPQGAMEYLLSVPHWLDALAPPLTRHIQSLAEVILRILVPETLSSTTRSQLVSDRVVARDEHEHERGLTWLRKPVVIIISAIAVTAALLIVRKAVIFQDALRPSAAIADARSLVTPSPAVQTNGEHDNVSDPESVVQPNTRAVFHNWWNYYDRGLDSMNKMAFGDAVTNFETALGVRAGARYGNPNDTDAVRTYGVNVKLIGYYPNRYLGVALCNLNRHAEAVPYLQKSLIDCPSDIARRLLQEGGPMTNATRTMR